MSDDHLYLFNTQPINLPRKSRRSSILKTIEGNLPKDDRVSRRVSFANNLFLQELKPDGTTQLLTEPFKSNLSDDKDQESDSPQDESIEQQVPVMRSDKRRKSSKNFRSYISTHYDINDQDDYKTIFNTSVNRNAKRKYENDEQTNDRYEKDDKLQKKDINALFCDDMELTSLDEKSTNFTFNNTAFSNMATTSLPKSNENIYRVVRLSNNFVNTNTSNMELTNLGASSLENSNMELTNLDREENSEQTEFKFSNCTPIVFSATANKNPERKFGNDKLIEDPKFQQEDQTQIGHSTPFCGNIDSNGLANLDKENQPYQPFNLTFNNTGFLTATTYMNSTAATDSIYKIMRVPKGFTASVGTNNNSSAMELTNLENSNLENDLEVSSSSNMDLTNLKKSANFTLNKTGILSSTTCPISTATSNDGICKTKQAAKQFTTSINTNNDSSNMELTNLESSNLKKAYANSTLNDSNRIIREVPKGFITSMNTNNNSSNMDLTNLESSNLEKAHANSTATLNDSHLKMEQVPKGFTTSMNTNNDSSNMDLTNLESSNLEKAHANSTATLNDSHLKMEQMPKGFTTSMNTNNDSSNMDLTNLKEPSNLTLNNTGLKSATTCPNSTATLNDSKCKINEVSKRSIASSVNSNNSSNMELTNLENSNQESSDMELTNLECSKSEANDMELTNFENSDQETSRKQQNILENSKQDAKDTELSNLESSNLQKDCPDSTATLNDINYKTKEVSNQLIASTNANNSSNMDLTNLNSSNQATNIGLNGLESSNRKTSDMELTGFEKSNKFTTPVGRSRKFSPRLSCSKLSTSSVKFKPYTGRHFTMASNSWAINKDKLHSTVNFKNRSLFNYRDNQTLELDSKFETHNNKNLNKTLPINFEAFKANEAQVVDDAVKSKDVCESVVSSSQDDKQDKSVDSSFKFGATQEKSDKINESFEPDAHEEKSGNVCESSKLDEPNKEEKSKSICRFDCTFGSFKAKALANKTDSVDAFNSLDIINVQADENESNDVCESSKMDFQTDKTMKSTTEICEPSNLDAQIEKEKLKDDEESPKVDVQPNEMVESDDVNEFSIKSNACDNKNEKSNDTFTSRELDAQNTDANDKSVDTSDTLEHSKMDIQTDEIVKSTTDNCEPSSQSFQIDKDKSKDIDESHKMDVQTDETVQPTETYDSNDTIPQSDVKEKSVDTFEPSKADIQDYEKEKSIDNCEPYQMNMQTDEIAKSNSPCESSNMSIEADEIEKSISVCESSKPDVQDREREKDIDNGESFKVTDATADEVTKSTATDICEPPKISVQTDEKSNDVCESSKSQLDPNDKTVDEMLNQIQLNYSIKVKELKNKSQAGSEFELTHGNLSTIVEPSNSELERSASPAPPKKVYNNKTFTLDKFNFSSKDQTPTKEPLKSTFTISNKSINNHPNHPLQSTFIVNRIDNKSITDIKLNPSRVNKTFAVQEDSINEIVDKSLMSIINKTIDRLNEENTRDLSETMEICEEENEKEVQVEEKPKNLIQDQLLSVPVEKTERRSSLHNNLSILEKELNKETINDSVLLFQTQTIYEEDSSKSITNDNNTTCQINELRNQIDMVNNLMSEKSFSTKYINDAIMKGGDEKIKNYFLQQNKSLINFKTFNGHVALYLDLEARCETEYSDIKDMNLILDFDKPILKFWNDKFYLFYNDKLEHKNFIDILKCVLDKQFNDLKVQLLTKYPTTEFQVNIKEEVELMLNRVSDFVKDVKITTLMFINYEFKFKQDSTFDFCINLFGVNRRFMVVLNISFSGDFQIKTRFNCWLEDKNYYPFDDIKTIVEESGREGSLRINKTIIRVNRFLKRLRKLYLEEIVRNALQNWNV